jgi:ferredoxin-NADP reductase
MKVFIKEKKEIAQGTVLFTFNAPDGGLSYVPGQYICLKLDLKFPDEKGPQRYFSIVNPDPKDGRIQIATRISDTGFKQTLDSMQPGEAGDITQIAGEFILPEDPAAEIVMVAGGVGVTPFKCMLEHLILKKEKRRITLLYSNKNKATTAFYDEFSQMAAEGWLENLFFVMTRDESWPGPKGRMNADFIADNIPGYREKQFMVAGPPNFVGGISQALEELELADVKLEKFFGY